MKPIINSYFSGAGLMDIGLNQGGCRVQQSFEIDPACCDTLRANFRHEVLQCDIAEKLVRNEKGCDVMVATYPCTRYSEGADIHGTRTGDALFLHFFRHLAIQKPEAYVVENVPGMRKFPVVMEAMTALPDYYVTTFCPVESSTWLPQQRPRLIILGSKRPFAWREPRRPSRRVRLRDIIEPGVTVPVQPYVLSRLYGRYRQKTIISDPAKDDLAPMCVAHYARDRSTRLVVDPQSTHGLRPYTVREYARLQGVPDTFQFIGGDRAAYRMIGNGVSVPVGRWIAQELTRYFCG